MNIKRCAMAALAAFVFVFLYDMLVHGYLLQSLYMETPDLWRPMEEHKFSFMILSQLAYSGMAAYIFTLNYEDGGAPEGIRFGLLIGCLVGSIQIGTQGYLPISTTLTASWVIQEIIRGLGTGIILSLVYDNNE
ncbi:MAG: hypothetical protein ACI9S8_002143 [Chlamydiales bacterium]|jgi:hypothetical protein